ncbi:MAG TPA: hypothetical protein VGR90_01400, partial [Acidimicrobiales bacterium]|nr:hypothetical protein [Acidimicrobiales bacterium]
TWNATTVPDCAALTAKRSVAVNEPPLGATVSVARTLPDASVSPTWIELNELRPVTVTGLATVAPDFGELIVMVALLIGAAGLVVTGDCPAPTGSVDDELVAAAGPAPVPPAVVEDADVFDGDLDALGVEELQAARDNANTTPTAVNGCARPGPMADHSGSCPTCPTRPAGPSPT